jgi:hypothetical protein
MIRSDSRSAPAMAHRPPRRISLGRSWAGCGRRSIRKLRKLSSVSAGRKLANHFCFHIPSTRPSGSSNSDNWPTPGTSILSTTILDDGPAHGGLLHGMLGKLFATPPLRTVRATRSAKIRDPARTMPSGGPLSSVESSRMISPVGA